MAFGQPFRPAGAPTQPAAPAYGQPPAPPAPAAHQPPPPPVQAPEPQFWASVNGQSVPCAASALVNLPPGTMVMPQDQSRPWAPKETYAPTATHPAPPPAAGFGGRQAPAAGGAVAGVPRGAFAGVENAEVYQRNPNLNEGKYIFELLEAEYKQLRAGGAAIIIEGRILVSTYDPNLPHTAQCNKEGTLVSIFVKQNDNFASNMKEIILALSGFDAAGNPRPMDDVVTAQECEELVAAGQVYKGRKVYLEATGITTKAGKPYTRVNWHPCPVDATGAPDMAKFSQLYAI